MVPDAPPPLSPQAGRGPRYYSSGGSTSCLLAGGWCPQHELLLLPASAAAAAVAPRSATIPPAGPDASRPPHGPLLPLDASDVLGLCLAAIVLVLSASGGIGGGAILVPLYLIVLGGCFVCMHAKLGARPSPCLPPHWPTDPLEAWTLVHAGFAPSGAVALSNAT